MRFTKKLTMAVLAAALGAAGCSKGGEEPRAQESAQPMNVSMTDRTGGIPPSGRGLPEPPNVTGPASFTDGEVAYQAGNYAEAKRVFEQYTVEKPANPWGHYMLGLAAWKGGDPAMAETAFDAALRLDPDHSKSLANLSRVLIEQGRFDDAVVRLTHADEVDSASAEVNRLFGRAYHGQGRIDDAVAAYRRAIALDGEDAWSMNNLGFLYLEQGRPYDALPPLARAVELRQDVPTFHNNLGMALEHAGRFAAAAAEYSSALEADPGYAKAQLNLMRVQAVKINTEPPFDLEATAQRFVDETAVEETGVFETIPKEVQIPGTEATAAK